jgi:hypothetical protein
LPREKSLAKKKYKFGQKKKVKPIIDISFAKKEKIIQEKI